MACVDGDIRLNTADLNFQSTSSIFGRVEICLNGTYGTIDDEAWSNTEASVVCRQLGLSSYG